MNDALRQMRKFRTKKARLRERRLFALKAAGAVFLGVCVLGFLIYATHQPQLRIQEVLVSAQGALKSDELAQAVKAHTEGMYLGFVPKDSVFFLSSARIERGLAEQFPRIRDIRIERAGATALTAVVQEREPAALWCGDVVPPIAYTREVGAQAAENAWGTCYLVDTGGFIYAQAPIYTGSLFPRYYGSLTASRPIGHQFIDSAEFAYWQSFYVALSESSFGLDALLFVDERDLELYLGDGLRVLASRTEDADVTRHRLIATLESGAIDSAKIPLYLDLRFGSKAYVKYVEQEHPTDED